MKEITLTQGKVALVDDDDYERISKYNWSFSNGYARRNQYVPIQKTILLHRFIMGEPIGYEVDHINGDGLDNRKENLRVCTHKENTRNRKIQKNNTSGFTGVVWDKPRNKWRAHIKYLGKLIFIGHFIDKNEASTAYEKRAKELFGDFLRKV